MIPLVQEPKCCHLERLGFEQCHFCGVTTRLWHENTNNPVCKPCAATHKVKELPDHGKAIRREKRRVREEQKAFVQDLYRDALLREVFSIDR